MKQLDLVRVIQCQYPTIALGGSLGLMLNGIDLGRDLSDSDIDMTSDIPDLDYYREIPGFEWNKAAAHDSQDMEFSYLTKEKFKAQIQVDEKHKSILIQYDDFVYRVSTVKHIIDWKVIYANRGVDKHLKDLEQLGWGTLVTLRALEPTDIIDLGF